MFKLTIDTDNAAFAGDDRGDVLNACLVAATADIAHGKVRGKIWASNGDNVGFFDCEARPSASGIEHDF